MTETVFFKLSDDVVLNIFFKLEEDPRVWSRLACVCTKFSSLIRNVCWKNKCSQTIPSLLSDLLNSGGGAALSPPGCWASLHKLAVCCPGLRLAGVLLENSDFGLERELGPNMTYQLGKPNVATCLSGGGGEDGNCDVDTASSSDCYWSLFDDLYFDTIYNASESNDGIHNVEEAEIIAVKTGLESNVCKKRKVCKSLGSHLASGAWNLSREQGNKLLASRFRGDCLYICDWPGCIHTEEKRNYMLFRGIFKNFKRSRVWRTINDGNRSKVDLNCVFCPCKETWDLNSAFCLRRGFGFHDDGEPVVRAYVCENGHVSGAWTDWPLYT